MERAPTSWRRRMRCSIPVCTMQLAIRLSGLGLRPFLDLELMLDRFQINWDIVVQRARAWRVKTATWLVLDLWAELFDHMDDVPVNELCPSALQQRILRRFVSFQSLSEGRALRRGLERRAYLLFLVDRPARCSVASVANIFPRKAVAHASIRAGRRAGMAHSTAAVVSSIPGACSGRHIAVFWTCQSGNAKLRIDVGCAIIRAHDGYWGGKGIGLGKESG